jgi:LPS export ABC transporter protein LptC
MFYTDSGYARIEVYAGLAETYSKPEAITKLKDGLKVNFFSAKGEIVSTLTALYGEVNFSKGLLFVKDSVRLVNLEKKQRLETEILFWNQKDSSIYTLSQVIIKSPKGTVLGDGIRTNQSFSKYVLLKPSGRVELEKEFEID